MNNKANKTSFKKGHGRLRTDESYRRAGIKISAVKKGMKYPPLTEEHKKKLSDSMKGRTIYWAEKLRGKNYGLSPREVRIKKLEAIAGRSMPISCEVCGREGLVVFDHDHKTGKFRGWICFKCNNALGMVNDSVEILEALIKYVRKNSK